MAIPGIGPQSSYQLTRPATDQQNNIRGGALERDAATGQTETANSGNAAKNENAKSTLLAPVPQSQDSSKTTSSRKNLAELEVMQKRLQYQSERNNLKGASGKAVQSFLEVADYERKDELTGMVGIDIFI